MAMMMMRRRKECLIFMLYSCHQTIGLEFDARNMFIVHAGIHPNMFDFLTCLSLTKFQVQTQAVCFLFWPDHKHAAALAATSARALVLGCYVFARELYLQKSQE